MHIRRKLFNLNIALLAAGSTARRHVTFPWRNVASPIDIVLCVVDHYEPQVGRPPRNVARERVCDWLERYPRIAARHRDWDGCLPTHSFFYPWDEYDAWEMSRLAELCASGFGEIELHLHHQDDTESSLRAKLREAIALYRSHGAISCWPGSLPAFGFIHGNWALDNSRHENGRNFCGVNNEITVLLEEGCYADFTFPAWKHVSQPRQLNCLHYAFDDPLRSKSYDTGLRATAGRPVTDHDALLLVQGPLVPAIDRSGRYPRFAMDDPDLSASRRFTPSRLDRWVRAGIHVRGRADRIFIKLHCHGAQDRNREALLGTDLAALFTDIETRYNDGKAYRLHYATARETFNIIKATEAGFGGDIDESRDWLLPPPAASRKHAAILTDHFG